MDFLKKVLKRTEETKRTYSYELDGISFNFTLRTDIKKELKAAIQILKSAVADFERDLEAIDNPQGTE